MFSRNKQITFLATIPFFVLLLLYIASITITNTKTLELSNGCDTKYAPFIYLEEKDYVSKISYCQHFSKDTMRISSEFVDVKRYISFDYTGNPHGPNTSIYIEDINGNRYTIPHLLTRGSRWTHRIIRVPDQFKSHSKMRIVAEDNSTLENGWVGIGNVIIEEKLEVLQLPMYVQTMLFILLFSIFISAIYGYLLKYYNRLDAFVAVSLTIGLLSLAVFYIYLYSVRYGKIVSIGIFILSLIALMRVQAKNVTWTLLLFGILSSMMMIILFLAYSDLSIPTNFQQISANRWFKLPIDNWIPKIFADAILGAHVPSPLVTSWLSSDRPPLATGFFLIFSVFSSNDLSYLVISVGMQLLVIIFIFMLLLKYLESYRFIFFVMLLLFFNGFVFVHSLFVWPKLLSALFQGISFYYLYYIWTSNDTSKKEYILFGLAASLAFLSHGGSVFYLLALSVLLLFTLKQIKDVKKIFYGLLVALITYLPWVLYQKLIDPPGDRLLKWHLAAEIHVTDKSFSTVLFDYYHQLSLKDWLALQWSHLERIYYSFYADIPELFSLPESAFLDNTFFGTDYSFIFFTIWLSVLYVFVKKQSSNVKVFIFLLLWSYFLYIVIWSVLLTGRTIIHQGSYFAWFSGFIAVTWITYNVNQLLFYILGSLNLLFFILFYGVPHIFHESIISGLVILLMVIMFIASIYQSIYVEIKAKKSLNMAINILKRGGFCAFR